MKRGQISIEFVTIFGFIFLMLIPLILIFFDQSGSVQDRIATNHLRNIAIKIADKSETTYYLGQPSKSTLKVSFPEQLDSVVINQQTITFRYRTNDNNLQDITATSLVNLTGNISASPGIHYITIEATNNSILISES